VIRQLLGAACLTAAAGLAPAQDTASGAEEAAIESVRAATQAWIDAFNARDAARISALYAPDAVFWGTISPTVRITPEAVLEYFASSAAKRPRLRMTVGESHVRVFGDGAVHAGYYSSIDPRDEGDLVTPLRFTFMYRREGGQWVIVSHHSSRMPAP